MSDKRPVQQDLARRLAHFMLVFEGELAIESAARYFHAFWFTMVREWRGLDVLRWVVTAVIFCLFLATYYENI